MTNINCRPLVQAGFTFKALRKWNGNEGIGFTANLYHNNRKVAEVRDDAWGGDLIINWVGLRHDGSIHTPGTAATRATAAKAELAAVVANMPPRHVEGIELTINAGWLLDEFASVTMMAKDCKRKTLFRRPSDGKGAYAVINAKFDPKMRAYINRKHPGSEILNDTMSALFAA